MTTPVRLWRWLLREAAGTLWPARCAACGASVRSGAVLCETCLEELPSPPRCGRCGEVVSAPGAACARCADRRFPWSVLRVLFGYEGPVRSLIAAWKYRGDTAALAALRRLMEDAAASGAVPLDASVVVPVATDPVRLGRRGFDHLDPLARTAARLFAGGAPVRTALKKVRATPPQVGLSEAQRRRSLAGAFVADEETVRGADVLLFDDVMTTGTTLRACARALRRAGAKSVLALVMAH